MSPLTSQAEDVQREMRQVRAELRDDVQQVVASAQVLGEWRRYVRTAPWLSLGAAAAVGYFLVPSRMMVIRPDAKALLELARAKKLELKMDSPGVQRPSLLKSIAAAAAGSVMQAGMALLSHQLNQFLAPTADRRPSERREGAYL
jgi:hypothetical protein